jgi:hypothetical protein
MWFLACRKGPMRTRGLESPDPADSPCRAQLACESPFIPTLDHIRGMSIAYITVIHRVQVDKAMSVMFIPTGLGNEKRIET